MKKFKLFWLIMSVFIFLSGQTVLADSNANAARKSLKTIRQELKKLKRLVNKPGVRSKLAAAAARSPGLDDSDSDGLPDVIENVEGTDSCSDDSDSDGVSDGDESSSGSDPDDSSSTEVELKGNISAITSNTVTVGAYTFTTSDTTIYRDGTGLASYNVGDFVEVSGRLISGVLTLKKIALED